MHGRRRSVPGFSAPLTPPKRLVFGRTRARIDEGVAIVWAIVETWRSLQREARRDHAVVTAHGWARAAATTRHRAPR